MGYKIQNTYGDVIDVKDEHTPIIDKYFEEDNHAAIDDFNDPQHIPSNTVKVTKDSQIKEYDVRSKEYKDLYKSGHLTNYDAKTNTYIGTPLKEATVTAEAPQWLKDKRQHEKNYTQQQFASEYLPKSHREDVNNLQGASLDEYNKRINNKTAESIFKNNPNFETDYGNDRLKALQGFTQKELEIIKNSNQAHKIEPSIWQKFEQGLLSVGNSVSPIEFKNENLTQEETKKESNPLNILQPLIIPAKVIQAGLKDNYSLGDALSGKQNNANIGEDIITDPLNLVGLGIWGKLKYTNKFKNLDEVYQSVKGLSKEEALNKLGNADNIINKGLDIHDVRLKYHNNQILDFDEHALLNLEGKGNVVNYRKTSTKDILGRTQIDDAKEATINMNKKNIEEVLFGKEQEKVVEKTNNIIDIENVKEYNFNYQEQNINTKSKIDWSSDDFIIHNVTPYERTATTREADKWISDWYNNPETKKKFTDYGGSEDEWKIVQNSLENPILSSSNWGKNRPRGLYMKGLDKASIPLNETTDIAIHEGVHKTKIALEKTNTILPKMYNDLVDAVKEVPSEVYPELGRLRYNLKLKPTDKLTLEQLDEGLKTISDGYSIKMKIKDKNKLLDILNKAPAILPFYLYLQNQNKETK